MVLLSIGVCSSVFGEELFTKNASIPDYGDSNKRIILDLKSLPSEIQYATENCLNERVGSDFRSKMNFVRAYEIDRDPSRNGRRTNDSGRYYLFFEIKDFLAGIRSYVLRIDFDKSGVLLNKIEIPPIRRIPVLGNFVQFSVIKETANKAGIDLKKDRLDLGYASDQEQIAWFASREIFSLFGRKYIKTVVISAHSGKVLDTGHHWRYD